MSAPLRWNVDPDATVRVRGLLAVAPRPRPMSSMERTRSVERVHRLASAPVPSPGLSIWKVVGGFTAAVAIATGATRTSNAIETSMIAEPRATTFHVEERTYDVALEESRTVEPADMGHVSASIGRSTAVGVAPVEPEPIDDRLDAEMRIVEAANARAKSNPIAAYDLAQMHAERFPNGHLWAEREVLAVDALARMGRMEEARARAARFLANEPESLYRTRIEEILVRLR